MFWNPFNATNEYNSQFEFQLAHASFSIVIHQKKIVFLIWDFGIK